LIDSLNRLVAKASNIIESVNAFESFGGKIGAAHLNIKALDPGPLMLAEGAKLGPTTMRALVTLGTLSVLAEKSVQASLEFVDEKTPPRNVRHMLLRV